MQAMFKNFSTTKLNNYTDYTHECCNDNSRSISLERYEKDQDMLYIHITYCMHEDQARTN